MLNTVKYSIIFISLPLMAMEMSSYKHLPEQIEPLPMGVYEYLSKLPTLDQIHARQAEPNSIEETAELITNFVCKFSNSKTQLSGVDTIQVKMARSIEQEKPIEFILLGYPTKSANSETRVLSRQFDMADFVGLLTLNHLCKEIGSVYAPGVQVTIYSCEPYVFELNAITHEHLGHAVIPEETIAQYQADLRQAAALFDTIIIGSIPNIRELYAEKYAHIQVNAQDLPEYRIFMGEEINSAELINQARARVYLQEYAAIIKKQPEFASCNTFDAAQAYSATLTNGKKKVITNLPVKAYMKKIADKLALCVAEGGPRMRLLMGDCIDHYNDYIRLSIRSAANGDVSSKLGIALVYGSSGTPWHNVLTVSKNGVTLNTHSKLKSKDGSLRGKRKYCAVGNLQLAYIKRKDQP